LLLLHEQIKYMIEYVLYWSYHNVGKNAEVMIFKSMVGIFHGKKRKR